MKLSILLFLTSAVVALPVFGQKKQLKAFDAYIEQARQQWDVPGLAVAIVKDGEVIHAKGYGVANVDTQAPVTEHTLFAIASNSKAYTAALLAMLVDEGRLDWDDKVQQYLPWFQLYDPYVSANMTVRDLLCHRSGLATFSGDLIWYGSAHGREAVVRRARHLEPVMGFRAGYGYQNIMFIAAGLVIEAITGEPWDDVVKSRILSPLEMNRTVTTVRALRTKNDVSAPHNSNPSGTGNHTIQWVNWDNVAPAGSLISSVHDCAQWLKLQLAGGTLDGTTYWSEAQHHEMWSMHTPEEISGFSREYFPSKAFQGYGLGWDLSTIHGRLVVGHGGGYDGMISKTVMVPEEGLGFIVLTNNINWLASALGNKFLDVFLGDPKHDNTDWAELYLGFKQGQDAEEAAAREAAEANRNKASTPSLPLEAYAGTYRSEMYGDVVLRAIGDQLAFQFQPTPLFRGTLRHWQYDSFELNWGTEMMLPSGTVQFLLNPSGEVTEMVIDVPNPDFDFTELKLIRTLGE